MLSNDGNILNSAKSENISDNEAKWYQMFFPKFVREHVDNQTVTELCNGAANLPFDKFTSDEDMMRRINENNMSKKMTTLEKEKIKELLNQIATKRKTRKDMPTRNSMKNSYHRGTQSASPLFNNRGHQESDSGDELEQAEDYDEDRDSYDNPTDIIDNELNESYTDTVPTAPTNNEDESQNPSSFDEDYRNRQKYDLKDLIYKLFLNIYNSEKEQTLQLKEEIFPRINEKTKLDDYITFAISNCMDHVKDELQLYIKKNLKTTKNTQKSIICDSAFVPVRENMEKYNEIIDKIVDFNELFKCSIEHIVEVWKDKLGHIERLYEIFDFRHKKLFSVNIWQDREIIEVIKLFLKETNDDKHYKKRVMELRQIDEELNESMSPQNKEMTSGKKQKKQGRKNKKNKKKNKKDNKKEKEGEKLYEIDDIDLLCAMIENTDKKKGKKITGKNTLLMKGKELKDKHTNMEKSPNKKKNKGQKKEKESLGKENKNVNKTSQENSPKEKSKPTPRDENPSPAEKLKKEGTDHAREAKASNSDSNGEESKEIEANKNFTLDEDINDFLKNCCKSKRKVLIKPNIPKKWIHDLRAKLSKIKSK